MTNPYGWNLPETDLLYDTSPYAPLPSPAQNIAERLTMLAHLSFNMSVWGSAAGRGDRYWPRFGESLEAAASTVDTASWWRTMMDEMTGVPLRRLPLVHEKNLLCHPTVLPTTSVEDSDVLDVFRAYPIDLRDRCRVWAKVRRDLRTAQTDEDDDF